METLMDGNNLASCRSMMLDVVDLGFPVADELLYPSFFPFFEDIISYVAIGARTSEAQLYREIASGLEVAVGLKNPTSGDLEILANSVMVVAPKEICMVLVLTMILLLFLKWKNYSLNIILILRSLLIPHMITH